MSSRAERLALLALALAALAVSGIGPRDRFTWLLEVAPVLIGVPILIGTHRRFPLTALLYRLLFVHALILILGGHYTYAEVPPGFWVRDALGLERNHYDRLGHFAQGFVPAILAREILLRCALPAGSESRPAAPGTSPLDPQGARISRGWLFFLVVCVCLAFSAFYELIEWWTAAATGEGAAAFLGTQGDPWDTQWDMFLALLGAITAQLLLARRHDRQLSRAVSIAGR